MIDSSFYLTFHMVEEYQQRLRDSARNARAKTVPHEPVMRRRIGRLLIVLGEFVQGQRASGRAEPADVRLATH